jgi:hypothetical protein
MMTCGFGRIVLDGAAMPQVEYKMRDATMPGHPPFLAGCTNALSSHPFLLSDHPERMILL